MGPEILHVCPAARLCNASAAGLGTTLSKGDKSQLRASAEPCGPSPGPSEHHLSYHRKRHHFF